MTAISQLSVRSALLGLQKGKAGQLYGDNRNHIEKNFQHGVNQEEDLDTVTPTAVNDFLYSYEIAGETIEYQADGSATAAEISAGMVAAHNDNPVARGIATAVDLTGTFTLESNYPGVLLSITYGTNLAAVNSPAGNVGDTIAFGVGVWFEDAATFERVTTAGTGLAIARFAGVTRYTYDEAAVTVGDAGSVGYPAGRDVIALRRGILYVEGDQADNADRSDDVWIDRATGLFYTASTGASPLQLDTIANFEWAGPNLLSFDITAGL